jgi:lysozyme family protein
MRARAEEFGGKFHLASGPGNGTSVRFSIPYTPSETPQEYLRKAVGLGALLVVSTLALARTKSPLMAAVSAFAAIAAVRYTVAYRRVRTRSEAAR